MANYYENRLKVEGEEEDIAAFVQACLKDSGPQGVPGLFVLDFAKILPPPAGLSPEESGRWEIEQCGTSLNRITFDGAVLTKTSYCADFSSAWSPPEGLVRAIAQQHPRLVIRFLGIEEGNEYCFKLDSRDGVIEAGNPNLTDELIEELAGKGEIETRKNFDRDWWEEPSELEKPPLRHFLHWWDEAKLKKALADYPIYAPPHIGLAAYLSASQAQENFKHFLSQKEGRLDALRELLQRFGVRLDFEESTKSALDQWLHRYGGLVYVEETRPTFYTHGAPWDGARRPLNVIFDLGVYLGEFAIRETPDLSWGLDLTARFTHGHLHKDFQRPSLVSASISSGYFPRDVLGNVYYFCDAHCRESYLSQRGGPMHRSRREARQFFTFALRDIYLHARGEHARANEESWARMLGK